MSRRAGATFRQLRLRCAAWLAVLYFSLVVPLIGFRNLATRSAAGDSEPPERLAGRVVAAVLGASRLVPWSTCLTRACAARALFALRGYTVMIRVGVRQQADGRMAAHAWLLSGQRVILGEDVEGFEHYRPIADFG